MLVPFDIDTSSPASTTGNGLTVAVVVPAVLVHPLTVAVTLYNPVAAVVALPIVGFCKVDVKLLGPVQTYVAPVTSVAVRFKVLPAHIGPLFPAVGAVGIALTVAVVVPAVLVHPLTVAMTLYSPVAAVVALAIVGFCKVDVKLLGPVQTYVAPVTSVAVRFKVLPAHIGPLFPAVGAVGIALTVAVVVPAVLVHPLTVAVTLYSPVAAVVALAIVGFCKVDVKLLGPVQAYVAPVTSRCCKVQSTPCTYRSVVSCCRCRRYCIDRSCCCPCCTGTSIDRCRDTV